MITINIAKDFTKSPGARFTTQGEFSGEEFRQKFLEKYFKDKSNKEQLKIILDGTAGYSTSFLDEAFGVLAREFGKTNVTKRIEFVSLEEPLLIKEVLGYMGL